MSKGRAQVYHVWRGWCPGCKAYLVARTLDHRRAEALECPTCKRRAPACRGSTFELKGDKVCTRTFWPEAPKE